MKLLNNLSIALFFFSYINANVYPTNIYELLTTTGHCEIGNSHFLKKDFNTAYKSFDDFIASIDNEKFMDAVDLAEKEFASMTPLANRYCSAPPSYRDPKMHKQKKHNKIYYQFIKENYDLLKLKYNDALANNQSAIAFLDTMVAIDQMAKKMFTDILDQMDKDYPGIKAIFYGKHDELTVITKIVRYEKTDNWGTTAHFDKSGLSFIWNSDDDNDDSLMTCKDVLTPSLDLLQKPVRLYGNRPDVSSTILIAGSAFSKVGINIKPTLHGVAPIKKPYRHAIISFLLIPDIDMSDLKTDFV